MNEVRTAIVLAAFTTLAACSPRGDELRGEPIECAIGPAGKLEKSCTIGHIGKGASAQLVVHHPDDGFRRFVLTPDGKGLMPADGAGTATSTITKGTIDVTIEQDRYRIPAAMVKAADDR